MKSTGKSYCEILKGQSKGVEITKLSFETLAISDVERVDDVVLSPRRMLP